MAAHSLEDVLSRLLVPDNAVLLQATSEIRQAIKNPDVIPELCNILSTSANVQVRQYAAVLLRKKAFRRKQWNSIQDDIKNELKKCILQVLHTEPEKAVRNSIAQLIGTVAKHELSRQRWPELLQLFNQYLGSTNVNEKEVGHFILNVVSSEAAEELKPCMLWLLNFFSNSLLNKESPLIPYYSVKTMKNLVPYVGTDEVNKFQPLVPAIMMVVKNLILLNEDHARETMEIFDELLESEVAIIVPHIKHLVEMCLEVTESQALDDSTRVLAMSILSSVLRLKKKSIIKHKLINSLLNVLFPIMCVPLSEDMDNDDEEEDDDDDDDEDSQHPASFAPQVINVMALHLPPEKFIPALMRHLEPALSSNMPYPQKASYTLLGVIAEGCSEYIRNNHLQKYLQVICKGIMATHPAVRNASLFALGQFAEFLQPEIGMFANEIMPILLQFLTEMCQMQQQGIKSSPVLTRTFYALDVFCENLEDGKLLPFLPSLMERLMMILSVSHSVQTKELAISALGSAANAAKEAMVPYFSQVIEILTPYIKEPQTENGMSLQVQSIDTLGVLARTVGTATFFPMAEDCIKFGLELLNKVDDPDLRRSVYGLFASVSTILKESMSQYLSLIIPHMMNSLLSTDGVEPNYSDDHETFLLFDDVDNDDESEEDLDNSGGDDDDDDECGMQSYSVTNAYVDEKEDTCCAIKEIAANSGASFLPYFEESFDVVKNLIEHPSEDIRRSAIATLGQFCISFYKTLQHFENLQNVLVVLVPKLISTIREDTERTVVLAALETLNDLLKELKQHMINESFLKSIIELVGDAYKHKFACQDESDGEDESNNEEAEYDGMLLEFAGDLIPSIARAMPHPNIVPYIDALLPFLVNKTTNRNSVSARSFSIGTLAELVEAMGQPVITPFVEKLLPVFLTATKDEDSEVRSNSFYGLGVLLQNAGTVLAPHYPLLLQTLFAALMKEKVGRPKDNICAAVARMILTNSSAVPLHQVIPVFLKCLPLKEDFDENATVFACIFELYSNRNEVLISNLPEVISIISHVIESKDITEETRAQLVLLMKTIYEEYPAVSTAVVQTLSSEGQQSLKRALGS